MRALTRSTSRRSRSPRCRSRVHAHSQLCPAACQSLHGRSVPLAAKVRGSAPPQPFPCPGRVTCPRGGPRPRAQPRPSAGPALSLQRLGDGDPAERGRDWSRHFSARAGLGLSQSHSASCFWTTLAREPTMPPPGVSALILVQIVTQSGQTPPTHSLRLLALLPLSGVRSSASVSV